METIGLVDKAPRKERVSLTFCIKMEPKVAQQAVIECPIRSLLAMVAKTQIL